MPGKTSPKQQGLTDFLFGGSNLCVETSCSSSHKEYPGQLGGTSEKAEAIGTSMTGVEWPSATPPNEFSDPVLSWDCFARQRHRSCALLSSGLGMQLCRTAAGYLFPSATSSVSRTAPDDDETTRSGLEPEWVPEEDTMPLDYNYCDYFVRTSTGHVVPRLVRSSVIGAFRPIYNEFIRGLLHAFTGTRPFREFLREWHIDICIGGGIKVFLLLVLVYLAWRWYHDSRAKFNERGAKFTGTQTLPVCLHCKPDTVRVCTVNAKDTMYKKFHLPYACGRCSLMPAVYGQKEAIIGLGGEEYQVVTCYGELNKAKQRELHAALTNILDSKTVYTIREAFLNTHLQTLHDLEDAWSTYLGLPFYDIWTQSYRQATPWKALELDVQRTELLALGNTGSASSNSTPAAGATSSAGSDDTARAAQPATATEDGGLSEATTIPEFTMRFVNRMRSVWQWTEEHAGQVPQMAIMKGPLDRVQELISVASTYHNYWFNRSMHAVAAETGAQPLESAVIAPVIKGPAEHVTWFTSNLRAFRLGPVFSLFSVFDTKLTLNMLSMVQGRTTPKEVYKKESGCAHRIARCYSCMKTEVLDKATIEQAFNELIEEYDNDLTAMLRGKFSQQQIDDMLETLEISLVSNIPKRQTNGKLEMIMKQEKFQRAVVDNKLMLLAINAVPGKVLEHIAFHKPEDRHKMQENPTRNEEVDRPSSGSTADAKIGTQKGGIFSRLTIKGEDRSKVLDRIISECSKPVGEDIMIGEIDQTGMELHERCDKAGDGVMGHFLGLLQHVSTVLAPKLQGRLCGKLDAKLVADIKSGMVLVMRVEGTALKIRFPDLYLDSGWLNTSHMNFENELFATLSAHVMNPEALFNKNRKTGRFYIEEGTHTWLFTSVPLEQLDENGNKRERLPTRDHPQGQVFPRKSQTVYFRPWIEGDDGAFRCSRIFRDKHGFQQAIVEQNYKDAGYSAKLKYIVDGRAEFVGAHAVVKNGLTDRSVPWTPAVGRYLLKIGVNTAAKPSPTDNAARAASLSIMFGGRIAIFATMFYNIMKSIIKREVKGPIEGVYIVVNPYSVESKVMSEGIHCLSSIVANADLALNRPAPEIKTQMKMIENSFELKPGTLSIHDMNKMMLLALEIHCDMDDETALTYLPDALRQ